MMPWRVSDGILLNSLDRSVSGLSLHCTQLSPLPFFPLCCCCSLALRLTKPPFSLLVAMSIRHLPLSLSLCAEPQAVLWRSTSSLFRAPLPLRLSLPVLCCAPLFLHFNALPCEHEQSPAWDGTRECLLHS